MLAEPVGAAAAAAVAAGSGELGPGQLESWLVGLLKQAGLLGCAVPEPGSGALMQPQILLASTQSVLRRLQVVCAILEHRMCNLSINGVGCAVADSVLMAARSDV